MDENVKPAFKVTISLKSYSRHSFPARLAEEQLFTIKVQLLLLWYMFPDKQTTKPQQQNGFPV